MRGRRLRKTAVARLEEAWITSHLLSLWVVLLRSQGHTRRPLGQIWLTGLMGLALEVFFKILNQVLVLKPQEVSCENPDLWPE